MKKNEKIEGPDLCYNSLNLASLAETYGTPLKVVFLDSIKERIVELKKAFSYAINELNYKGKFIYAVANKANYASENLITSALYSDAIEVSSYYDLCLTQKLFKIAHLNKMIICNGYKDSLYLNKIIEMNENGYFILDIVDSMSEYQYLVRKANKTINIGLRVNLKALYSEEGNDRFGLTKEEIMTVVEDLVEKENVKCTTIHFHQRGIDYEDDKFYQNLLIIFEEYVGLIIKKIQTIENINLGGGTPLPVNDDFDYQKWALGIIQFFQKYNFNYNIILENGRYTFKDSMVNIYKIIGQKETVKGTPWYIMNGSLLVAMTECYEIGENLKVAPISLLANKMVKAKLAGVTCDCDDIYYEKDKGYMLLPEINENENLYIGLLGTGSYQESMSGRNGIHHCLLPEEKRLIAVKKGDGYDITVANELQSVNDMARIIKCNRVHLKKFF